MILLGSVPFVASDFGGVLHWTQHIVALAIMTAFSLALLGHVVSLRRPMALTVSRHTHALTGLLVFLAAYAWLQTIALPASTVSWLSPASHTAYMQWAWPLMATDQPLLSFPVSIAPHDSRHTISFLVIGILITCAAPILFHTRDRVAMLLLGIAIGGAITAAIGIARKLVPSFHMWSFLSGGEGSPFGTFLNRNNAALLMNLGLGSGLGILVWRLRSTHDFARHRHRATENRYKRDNDWIGQIQAVFSSPLFSGAFLCVAICLVGIVVCGSRGGLLCLLAANLVSLSLFRSGRKMAMIGIAAVALVGGVIVLALPSEISQTPLDQIESSISNNASRMTGDARLAHWPDGWRAFWNHLPMGSGLSSYSFAYLPFQQTSPWRWYHHADNLWLEMMVELGIGGIVLCIAMWTVVFMALRRLQHSHDSIDDGLRIAGWYVATVLIISQAFDFGLIIPANLIAIAMLMPTIVTRASLVVAPANSGAQNAKLRSQKHTGQPSNPVQDADSEKKPKVALKRNSKNKILATQSTWALHLPVMIGLLMIVIAIYATRQLQSDAKAEHSVRSAWFELEAIRNDFSQLSKRTDELDRKVNEHPTAELIEVASRFHFQKGRLQEIQSLRPGDTNELKTLYRDTARTVRRLAWRKSTDKFPLANTNANKSLIAIPVDRSRWQSDHGYRRSLQLSQQQLMFRPMSLQPRTNQIYLEYLHQDLNRSKHAMVQSWSLYRNDPKLLIQLAKYSADSQETNDAIQMWNRALWLRPEWTNRVINAAMQYSNISIAQIVPNTPQNNLLARQYAQGNEDIADRLKDDPRFKDIR